MLGLPELYQLSEVAIPARVQSAVKELEEIQLEHKVGGLGYLLEKFVWLLFARLLGEWDKQLQNNGSYFFPKDLTHLRWENIVAKEPKEQLRLVDGYPTSKENRSWEEHPWMSLFHFLHSGLKYTCFSPDCFSDIPFLKFQNEALLSSLIKFVDKWPISNVNVNDFELFVYAISKKRYDITPDPVARLMVALAEILPGDKVCDPLCKTGALLTKAIEYQSPTDSAVYYGYDENAFLLQVAVTSMLLRGCHNSFDIKRTCTISRKGDYYTPQFYQTYSNQFDKVITHPPIGNTLNRPLYELDTGIKMDSSEYMALGVADKILKDGGRCVIVLQDNYVFRLLCKENRRRLIEENQLDAVIFLSRYVIPVFTKGGTTDKIFFYRFNEISDASVDAFVSIWKQRKQGDFGDTTNNYFYVTKEEVVSNDYDLSFGLYSTVVLSGKDYEEISKLLMQAQKKQEEMSSIVDNLKKLLER